MRAAATRYVFFEYTEASSHCPPSVVILKFSPLLGYEHRNGASLSEYPMVQPLDEMYRPGHNRRFAFISSV